MEVEEKIAYLESQITELSEKVDYLTAKENDEFLTIKQLADKMQCSAQTIHNKIKEGIIITTGDKVGDPRIPISQFYPSNKPPIKLKGRKKLEEGHSLQKQIFG